LRYVEFSILAVRGNATTADTTTAAAAPASGAAKGAKK
jgi:hypothetical protein